MAFTLHFHPLASYCHKVLIALYERDVPFEGRIVNLGDAADRAALAAISPWVQFPVLEDTARGRVVNESAVIIEYLDAAAPGPAPMLPRDADQALDARTWERRFDAHVMTPMQAVVADTFRPEGARDAHGVAQSRAALAKTWEILDRHLDGRTWAATPDFGLADCAAAPSLFYAAIVQPFAPEQHALAAYFERLMARPSVARTLAEARPYFEFFPLKDAMPARFR